MQNSLAGRDCSHGQDLVAAEHLFLPRINPLILELTLYYGY
jgi:hypothetical protein